MSIETKPVKCTPAQRRRLITALAYINTHRREWKQTVWRCGTGMCLAGHLSVTLNPSRTVVPLKDLLDATAIQKKVNTSGSDKVTVDQLNFMYKVEELEDYLIATLNDNPDEVQSRRYNGQTYKTVSIASRAVRLIGELADFSVKLDGDERTLFNGSNNYTDLIKITAAALGVTTAEVKREVAEVVQAHGWDQPQVSA